MLNDDEVVQTIAEELAARLMAGNYFYEGEVNSPQQAEIYLDGLVLYVDMDE